MSCLTIFLCFWIFSLLWFNLFFGTQGRPHRILVHYIYYLYQIFPQTGPEQSQDASSFSWAARAVSVARLRTGQPGVGLFLGKDKGVDSKISYADAVASVMSDSVRPHRQKPTRHRCPWDSPGKNTGVGCHFPLQCMKEKSESELAPSCLTLSAPWTTAYQAPPSMDFPGKSTGVGCHCLLH